MEHAQQLLPLLVDKLQASRFAGLDSVGNGSQRRHASFSLCCSAQRIRTMIARREKPKLTAPHAERGILGRILEAVWHHLGFGWAVPPSLGSAHLPSQPPMTSSSGSFNIKSLLAEDAIRNPTTHIGTVQILCWTDIQISQAQSPRYHVESP